MNSMPQTLIGIGEMVVTNNPHHVLTAPNLGSCVGVAAYDPIAKVGGMIHCLLPLSTSNKEKAKETPTMFVDTGVVKMLNDLVSQGAELRRLVIAVAGGSNINDTNNVFEIGKKNYTVLRKVLWKNNLLIKGEHIGESFSRTISLSMSDGKVRVKVQGEIIELV